MDSGRVVAVYRDATRPDEAAISSTEQRFEVQPSTEGDPKESEMSKTRRFQVLFATAVSVALMLSFSVVPALASGKYP
jgi:hypothetical protein